ncbi:MAG: sterol desaturase family protein [Casimicrobiaceae bacterium]
MTSVAMNPTLVVLALAGLVVVLLVLERRHPLRVQKHAMLRRLILNAAITALAVGTAFALVKPAIASGLQHVAILRVGLLQWIDLPPALALVVGVLLLDLTFYFWHMANHRVPWLWRFHLVHHIDPDLDVSTAFRFHYGEVALSAAFRMVQIVLIGASPLIVATYEIIFQASTLFQHSNVRLPFRLERILIRVLVTPRMHGIHHSEVPSENRSNFSVVFNWWDRLHRTLRLNVPQQRIMIGIPAYGPGADTALGTVLMLPFGRQRDAWRRPDGTLAKRAERLVDAPLHELAA